MCATACHEGAIDIINGKAKLVRENFCDGFGDCLPGCPTGAITFEEREAPAYDEAAVQENKKKKELQEKMKHLHEGGCPGSRMRMLEQPEAAESAAAASVQPVSRLRNWPVQIKLAPVHAPYFEGAKLLIAADCTAYAYANFHQEFMRGKVTLIGCPKLDAVDYSEKLTEILRSNDIQSVTILRMEVPCCGGLEMAAKKALQTSEKFIPWQVVTISIDGKFWIKSTGQTICTQFSGHWIKIESLRIHHGCFSEFIAIQLFNATATMLNCISQICCLNVALISDLR